MAKFACEVYVFNFDLKSNLQKWFEFTLLLFSNIIFYLANCPPPTVSPSYESSGSLIGYKYFYTTDVPEDWYLIHDLCESQGLTLAGFKSLDDYNHMIQYADGMLWFCTQIKHVLHNFKFRKELGTILAGHV